MVFSVKMLMAAALPDADLPPIAAAVANLLYAEPKRVNTQLGHIRQSGTDSGIGFQENVLNLFQVVPSSPIAAAVANLLYAPPKRACATASERRRNNLKGFENFYLKSKAGIWP